MKKQTLFIHAAAIGLMGLSLFATSVARADGDPNEVMFDATTADTNIPTITAEGDFLVPNYLLPTQTPRTQNTVADATPMIRPQTVSAAPVVVVNPSGITYTSTPVQTGTATVRPIRVESGSVVSDYPVTVTAATSPRPVAQPASETIPVITVTAPRPVSVEIKQHPAVVNTQSPVLIAETQPIVQSNPEQTAPKKQLLLPLAPIVETAANMIPDVKLMERRVVPSDTADRILADLESPAPSAFIMPTEFKVTFYKDSTQLSGQTLKWIKAFALQTIKDPRLAVEIRMSQTDPDVQARRFAVIKNTLLGMGLSTHQIQVSYTKRSPDSFVLRAANRVNGIEIAQSTTSTGKKIEKQTVKW